MKKDISLVVFQAAAVLIVAALIVGAVDILAAADLYDVYAVLMASGCILFYIAFAVMLVKHK